MIGPMSIKILPSVESHQFYKEYGVKAEEEKRLKNCRRRRNHEPERTNVSRITI